MTNKSNKVQKSKEGTKSISMEEFQLLRKDVMILKDMVMELTKRISASEPIQINQETQHKMAHTHGRDSPSPESEWVAASSKKARRGAKSYLEAVQQDQVSIAPETLLLLPAATMNYFSPLSEVQDPPTEVQDPPQRSRILRR